MEKLDVALERIIGVTAAWMRPPNGSYNDVVLEVAGKRGQNVVLWDFNSRDTSGITTEEIQDAYVDLADQHPCNALTLNVETRESTVLVLTLPCPRHRSTMLTYSFNAQV